MQRQISITLILSLLWGMAGAPALASTIGANPNTQAAQEIYRQILQGGTGNGTLSKDDVRRAVLARILAGTSTTCDFGPCTQQGGGTDADVITDLVSILLAGGSRTGGDIAAHIPAPGTTEQIDPNGTPTEISVGTDSSTPSNPGDPTIEPDPTTGSSTLPGVSTGSGGTTPTPSQPTDVGSSSGDNGNPVDGLPAEQFTPEGIFKTGQTLLGLVHGIPISPNAAYRWMANPRFIQCFADVDPKNPMIEDKTIGVDVTYKAWCVPVAPYTTIAGMTPSQKSNYKDIGSDTKEFVVTYKQVLPTHPPKVTTGQAVIQVRANINLYGALGGSGDGGNLNVGAPDTGSGGLSMTGSSPLGSSGGGLNMSLPQGSITGGQVGGSLSGADNSPLGAPSAASENMTLGSSQIPAPPSGELLGKMADALSGVAHMAASGAPWGSGAPINLSVSGFSEGFGMLGEKLDGILIEKGIAKPRTGMTTATAKDESTAEIAARYSAQGITPEQIRRDNQQALRPLMAEAYSIYKSQGRNPDADDLSTYFDNAGFYTRIRAKDPGWYFNPLPPIVQDAKKDG